MLSDLVEELEYLRRPLEATSGFKTPSGLTPAIAEDHRPTGLVAQRMLVAARQFSLQGTKTQGTEIQGAETQGINTQGTNTQGTETDVSTDPDAVQERVFVTPMIAVAGSVADHVLKAMRRGRSLRRAYVNNGGDIALWLADGERFTVGICNNIDNANIDSTVELQARHKLGGIATSGWRGRSHSLGIADAVTVLAACAADADAAATLIANAVDLPESACIQRQPASALSPDSDLGNRLVTVAVGPLGEQQVTMALERGRQYAQGLIAEGLIAAAYISLQNKVVVCKDAALEQLTDLTPLTRTAGAMHA